MEQKEVWKEHKIQIEILTPVIIGTGNIYDYGELFIYKNKLYKINLNNLIRIMDPVSREKYIKNVSKGLETRDVKFDKLANDIVTKTLKVNSNKFGEFIRRPVGMLDSGKLMLDKKPFQNIEKICTKKINEKPYIPGSSIKGAIRTALIQSELNLKNIQKYEYINGRNYIKTKAFESNILNVRNSVQEDPFKYIKVSDFEFVDFAAKEFLGEVKIKTKNNYMNISSTMSDAFCLNQKKVLLNGTISISSKLKNILGLKNNYVFSQMIDNISNFYIDNYNSKYPKLPTDIQSLMTNLIQNNINAERGLIKIGRFSGIENITYNVEQDLSINRKIYNESINIEGGDSYALIEDKYLPGYCILSEVKK